MWRSTTYPGVVVISSIRTDDQNEQHEQQQRLFIYLSVVVHSNEQQRGHEQNCFQRAVVSIIRFMGSSKNKAGSCNALSLNIVVVTIRFLIKSMTSQDKYESFASFR